MLTVKERDNDYTEAALKELNGTLGENERVLIMDRRRSSHWFFGACA